MSLKDRIDLLKDFVDSMKDLQERNTRLAKNCNLKDYFEGKSDAYGLVYTMLKPLIEGLEKEIR